jgi:vacuolar-type H+-ATPase subunit E/Vma4
LRAKFLEEANRIIDEERKRSQKIHEEEVSRMKDILSWQQKKQDDAYQLEINSLKSSLGLAA